jgi:hypothetical protein
MILYSAQRIVLLILAAIAARNIGLRRALIILGVCMLASLPYLLFVVDPGWLRSLVLETAMVWLVALALIWLIDTMRKIAGRRWTIRVIWNSLYAFLVKRSGMTPDTGIPWIYTSTPTPGCNLLMAFTLNAPSGSIHCLPKKVATNNL